MKSSIQLLLTALAPHCDSREARNIAELVVEEVTGWDRAHRLLHADEPLPDDQRRRVAHLADLLAKGVPVQQVLGYADFCGRRFAVSRDVLIPRPETAELVRWVEEEAPAVDNVDNLSTPRLTILDIGTGSGCIALTLAADIHQSDVTAIDISTPALRIAATNAERLGVSNIRFSRMDILSAAEQEYAPTYQQVDGRIIRIPTAQMDSLVENSHSDNPYSAAATRGILDVINSTDMPETAVPASELADARYDIIVSNPPYIPDHEASAMAPRVLDHEPAVALFVPDHDPLLFYRAIGRYARRHLKPGGHLYVETHERYADEVVTALRLAGLRNIRRRRDMQGKQRMVGASL